MWTNKHLQQWKWFPLQQYTKINKHIHNSGSRSMQSSVLPEGLHCRLEGGCHWLGLGGCIYSLNKCKRWPGFGVGGPTWNWEKLFQWFQIWNLLSLKIFQLNSNPCCEAMKDGLVHPEVRKLASLGNSGAQPSHVSRDLVRALAQAFKELPLVSLVKLPVMAPKLNEILEIPLEVQFPHDIFAHYAFDEMAFNSLFGSPEQVNAFWEVKDLNDPAFRQHPALRMPDFQKKCIPCKLHSDGVEMSKSETLHGTSWCSFLSQGGVLEAQMLFGAIVKSAACPDQEDRPGTMHELYAALSWSFDACLRGLHPARDWKGNAWAAGSDRAKKANQPLHPEGFFLGVFQLLGDLEELANNYGLSHWASLDPCFWCGANTTDRPWTDFSPQAAWRGSLREPQLVNPPPSDHQVWTIPGLNRWSVGWDVLHGLDLGPTLHVLGNSLEDLVQVRGMTPTTGTSEAPPQSPPQVFGDHESWRGFPQKWVPGLKGQHHKVQAGRFPTLETKTVPGRSVSSQLPSGENSRSVPRRKGQNPLGRGSAALQGTSNQQSPSSPGSEPLEAPRGLPQASSKGEWSKALPPCGLGAPEEALWRWERVWQEEESHGHLTFEFLCCSGDSCFRFASSRSCQGQEGRVGFPQRLRLAFHTCHEGRTVEVASGNEVSLLLPCMWVPQVEQPSSFIHIPRGELCWEDFQNSSHSLIWKASLQPGGTAHAETPG